MLVYASTIWLKFAQDFSCQDKAIAHWLGSRIRETKYYFDPLKLSKSGHEKMPGNRNYYAEWVVSDHEYPKLKSIKFSHQDNLPGREWITEIGLKIEDFGSDIECSVFLRAEDISVRVVEKPIITRPGVVPRLLEYGCPSIKTPGLFLKDIGIEESKAFAMHAEKSGIDNPMVLLSADEKNNYLINPENLLYRLKGISDVYLIPANTDSHIVCDNLGNEYAAYNGAITIIFPSRAKHLRKNPFSIRLLPEQINSLTEHGKTEKKCIEEIQSIVLHRVNLANYRKHISYDRTKYIIKAKESEAKFLQWKAIPLNDDVQLYKKQMLTLEGMYKDQIKETEESLKNQIEELMFEQELYAERLESKERELQDLNLRMSCINTHKIHYKENDTIIQSRDYLLAVLNGSPSLFESLSAINLMFPERVIILDSAWESSKKGTNFKYKKNAFELLIKLTTRYWSILADGGNDEQAKIVFGQNEYSSKEKNNISKDGRRRREFLYNGEKYYLEKHLKFGVKDSPSETLRIHFEWLQAEKKILIGHCGAHLDF
ncbi:MAG: hypothetical protein H7839_15780 [Magnetococcus sp. YQC-5]